MPNGRACPGLSDPPVFTRAAALQVVEQVPGAGQQLAGDRDGGDLLPAALGDGRVGGGELRGPLGGLGCLVEHPAQPGRALLICAPGPRQPVAGSGCCYATLIPNAETSLA